MSESIPSGFNKCTKCGHIKDLASFHNDKKGKDGVKSACKDCLSEYRRSNYEINRRLKIKRQIQYNTDHKDELKNYQNKYQEEHQEIIQVKNKVNWLEKILFEPEFGYLNT